MMTTDRDSQLSAIAANAAQLSAMAAEIAACKKSFQELVSKIVQQTTNADLRQSLQEIVSKISVPQREERVNSMTTTTDLVSQFLALSTQSEIAGNIQDVASNFGDHSSEESDNPIAQHLFPYVKFDSTGDRSVFFDGVNGRSECDFRHHQTPATAKVPPVADYGEQLQKASSGWGTNGHLIITILGHRKAAQRKPWSVLEEVSDVNMVGGFTGNAIPKFFVKFNIYFVGLLRKIAVVGHMDGTDFTILVADIGSMGFLNTNLHWRYNLMANRVLLLLAMASRDEPNIPIDVLMQISGHFLKNLRSQLLQTRIVAISALNTLLKESPYKYSAVNVIKAQKYQVEDTKPSLEEALTGILQEKGFFSEILNSLSHVHIINDMEAVFSKGNYDGFSWQNSLEKSITRFYFDFSVFGPRTPSWISLFGNDNFHSNLARVFKRLIQECGLPVLLRNSLEMFVAAKERSKQCVAAEALAGVLHSDVFGVSEVWEDWIEALLHSIIYAPSVESIPEWAADDKVKAILDFPNFYFVDEGILPKTLIDCWVWNGVTQVLVLWTNVALSVASSWENTVPFMTDFSDFTRVF